MASGDTQYTETPWGLFSAQQLFVLMVYHYTFSAGLNITNPTDVAGVVNNMYTYWGIVWPLVEAKDL